MPSETIDSTKQFEFQISDWNSYHELDQEEEEKYVIQLFGRTEDDHDVCLKVTGYTPFFYVEIPKQWKQRQVDKFVEILKNKVQYHCKKNLDEDFDLSKSLIKYAMVKKHKFYNFRNKQLYNFLLLVFKSHTAMKEFSSILARPLEAKGLTNKPMLYQRYESNIEPHIRFMHINNLSSCGWASIDKDKLKKFQNILIVTIRLVLIGKMLNRQIMMIVWPHLRLWVMILSVFHVTKISLKQKDHQIKLFK